MPLHAPLHAIVPLKGLAQAKSRLAAAPGVHRETLVRAMLERVLRACDDAALVDDVVVAAADDTAADLAGEMGVRALRQSAAGLNAAITTADDHCRACDATLVVVGDLPLVRGADLDAVCRRAHDGAAVVVAPTRDGGTGALLRRPPGVIAPAFGVSSALMHERRASAAGVRVERVWRRGLWLDVDTPASLREALRLDPGLLPEAATDPHPGAYAREVTPPGITDRGHPQRNLQRKAGHADGWQKGGWMPQGTIKHFDHDTGTGTVLLDSQEQVAFDAAAFAASGLEELRLGQRVRFELVDRDGEPHIEDLRLVSL